MKSRHRWFPNGEGVLLLVCTAEIVFFSAVAPNFFTLGNFFEISRFSVELGLLAVALTPVIVAGGIDLSVGSMMGLAAVTFGSAYHTWHLALPLAALCAVLVGCAGGALNALLIARLKMPALIVTLGTYSLFHGVAEGITRGAVSYTGFPSTFLFLGQGYLAGVVPTQLPAFVLIVCAYIVLLHRSVIGRALYTIGFTTQGARYAGLPVARRVALVYVLSGLTASVSALIYVAHLGQARADAGAGYELDALTAVVLGGTSVFGGRGTIAGTLLGLFALVSLQTGMHLAAWPAELTGVLTGVLLVATIAADRHIHRRVRARPVEREDLQVKNSQVAVLCGAILAAALMVAGTNVWLIRTVSGGAGHPDAPQSSAALRRLTIAVMPKAKGDPYFVSCRAGAEEAARELGVDLIWDGPTSLDAAKQNELVENWITRKVDAIAVAVENRGGISTVLRKARARGIPVLTWDADAEPDAREFFVNQATAEGIANALTDEASRLLHGRGEFAIITGALSAANQNEWIAFIKKRLESQHTGMTLVTIRPSDDDRDKAFAETQTLLKVYPSVKLMMAISAPAVPGAAEAVRQAGRTDVNVIGLSLPNINKPYVHEGVVQTVVLWNTRDLGYLAVYASVMVAQHRLSPGGRTLDAGRLGTIEVRDTQIILGAPMLFNRSNIDRFDF